MGKPAARITDFHMCPMVTPGVPPIPHVGGPILPPGVPTVLIGGLPAATLGSMCVCTGPPDSIILGSIGVLIGGRPAARMGDQCAHGGMIMAGCPTVLIGEINPPSPGAPLTPEVGVQVVSGLPPSVKPVAAQAMAMVHAATLGLSLVPPANNEVELAKAITDENKKNEEKGVLQFTLKDINGNPVEGENYQATLPDGSIKKGQTDKNGEVKISGIEPGNCKITFPDIHGEDWA